MGASIGVDVGGTKILIGLVSEGGEVLFSKRYPMRRATQEEAEQAVFSSAEDFREALAARGLPAAEAVGMGTVGHIDYERGVWLQSYNIPISRPVEAAKRLEEIFGLPARLDNDVHCAALGEGLYGRGRGARCMLYINVGTGLSAGLLQNGVLLRGADNYAGEIGGMLTGGGGERLEPLASGGGLIAAARAGFADFPESALCRRDAQGGMTAADIFDCAGRGDPLAERLVNRAADSLGAAVCNLMAVANPDAVVFGGGAVRAGRLVGLAEAYVRRYCVGETLRSLRYIGLSGLDAGEIGLIGAASLHRLAG